MTDLQKTFDPLVHILFFIGVTVIKDALGAGLKCCRISGTSVDCLKCQLTSLPVSLMNENITTLNLSENNISSIPDGSFENMTSLRSLNLQGNPLRGLTKEAFKGIKHITYYI